MEQYDAPLLLPQTGQNVLQQRSLLCGQTGLLLGNGVPFCLAENGVALRAPQAHQAQIPADRQQPAHGRAGGAILRGVIPHMNEYILRDILCVVGVFQVRQRQTIHRRSGEMVELRQRILLPGGDGGQQLRQMSIAAGIFDCGGPCSHRLLSPVIPVMRGDAVLLREK